MFRSAPPSLRSTLICAGLVTLCGGAELAVKQEQRGLHFCALLASLAVVLVALRSQVLSSVASAVLLVFWAKSGTVPISVPTAAFTLTALAGASVPVRVLWLNGSILFAGVATALALDSDLTHTARAQNTVLFFALAFIAWYLRHGYDKGLELAQTKHQLAAVEARVSLARDIHDITAYSLTTVLTQLRVARQRLESAHVDTVAEAIRISEVTAKEALADMRGLTALMADGASSSSATTVRQLAQEIERTVQRSPEATFECDSSNATVAPVTSSTAVRLVQQCLANAQSHAPGKPVRLRVTTRDGTLVFEAENDMAVHSVQSEGLGMGLQIMRQRVEEIGGTLESNTEHGVFAVRSILPLQGKG
jgi:signal transduction histidine kinase